MVNRFNLTYDDWGSVGKGALVAVAGAILTYASEHLSAQDYGVYGPLVAAVLAVVVNYFRKVLSLPVPDQAVPEPEPEEEFVDEEVGEIEIDDSFPEEGEFGGSDDKPLNDKSVK